MEDRIRLIAKITNILGHCRAGHNIGEEFDVHLYEEGKWNTEDRRNARIPKMCAHLYSAIFPYISVLQYGGEFPWMEDKDLFRMNCPDPENAVSVEIRRIRTRGKRIGTRGKK